MRVVTGRLFTSLLEVKHKIKSFFKVVDPLLQCVIQRIKQPEYSQIVLFEPHLETVTHTSCIIFVWFLVFL